MLLRGREGDYDLRICLSLKMLVSRTCFEALESSLYESRCELSAASTTAMDCGERATCCSNGGGACGLERDGEPHDASAPQLVCCDACKQDQQKGWSELDQPDPAKECGIACQVIYLPADRHRQNLGGENHEETGGEIAGV